MFLYGKEYSFQMVDFKILMMKHYVWCQEKKNK